MDAGVVVAATDRVSRAEAQRAFCEVEYAALARYCYRLTGNVEDARDVAQEAIVRLFGRWTAVREPRAYAYLVATNLVRHSWRRRRDERLALEQLPKPQNLAPPDSGVWDAVDRLPRKWRDVVVLHYYADLPVTEVARQLGQPEGTVKRRLSEARTLLAPALREETP